MNDQTRKLLQSQLAEQEQQLQWAVERKQNHLNGLAYTQSEINDLENTIAGLKLLLHPLVVNGVEVFKSVEVKMNKLSGREKNLTPEQKQTLLDAGIKLVNAINDLAKSFSNLFAPILETTEIFQDLATVEIRNECQ